MNNNEVSVHLRDEITVNNKYHLSQNSFFHPCIVSVCPEISVQTTYFFYSQKKDFYLILFLRIRVLKQLDFRISITNPDFPETFGYF